MADDEGGILADLVAYAADFGVDLGPQAVDRLRTFSETLLLWGQRSSLSGATNARVVLLEHVLDSLHICPHLPAHGRLADLGSGAGFPAIALAIAHPSTQFVLVESRRKRANFLRQVIRLTGLENAEVKEARAEELAVPFAASFDTVTSRALGSTTMFLRLAEPILKPGGAAIAMKGPTTRHNGALREPGFGQPRFDDYLLPNGRRLSLIIVEKT